MHKNGFPKLFLFTKETIFQHFPFPVRSICVITKTGSGRRFLLPNRLRAWYDESSNFSAALRRQEEGFLMDECLLEKYELKSEECLFIDDRKENVEMALSLGFSGIHCQDPNDLKEEVRKVLYAL